MRQVAIVGASLAGLRAVEAMRTAGFDGAITVIGDEPHLPYDRPPLSKRLLAGEWEPDRILLRKPDDMDSLGVTWRSGCARRRARSRPAAACVWPTVTRCRSTARSSRPGRGRARCPVRPTTPTSSCCGRSTTRSPCGRASRAVGSRVVVVGAGFIGLEVAATARKLGNDVLVLEAGPAPLIRGLGAAMGAAVAGVHADHGVEVRCGVTIEGFAPGAVLIDGGWHEPADVVVVGIGVTPATEWLDGSGLAINDGIVCHPDLSTGAPLVYAAGDVVRWHNTLFDEEMRVEHWTNAAEQGAAAGSNLLAEDTGLRTTPYAPVPFFWSEQYDRRVQFLGRAHAHHEVRLVLGSVEERQFVALYGDGRRLRAVLGMNSPRQVMPFRNLLLDRADWDTALAFAVSLRT
jgi:NADPH-dependent 2,4-dienoyl-CoA reductase/sulfur reductase-like enzyme